MTMLKMKIVTFKAHFPKLETFVPSLQSPYDEVGVYVLSLMCLHVTDDE